MPTVNYGESLRKIHADLVSEWEAADKETRGPQPELQVIPELEHVNITYPDEWKISHQAKYHEGWSNPDNATAEAKSVYAAIELCDSFEGIEIDNINDMPLHYWQFFQWMAGVVLGDYFKGKLVPNGSTPPPQTTRRGSKKKSRSG
jgi:hypothetical protein